MIEVKQLKKKFGQKLVYQGLDYQFEAGKSSAIMGESGSGKSTFLNALARLEKPTSGTIKVAGQDIWQMKEASYFQDHLGYIFQNYALIDDETVSQNLGIVDKHKARQVEVLCQVGLDASYLTSKIYELSGGQAQRIAIARLLLKKSDVILADEPTGALDEKTAEEVEHILLSLVRPDTILIVATHDQRLARKMDVILDMATLNQKGDKLTKKKKLRYKKLKFLLLLLILIGLGLGFKSWNNPKNHPDKQSGKSDTLINESASEQKVKIKVGGYYDLLAVKADALVAGREFPIVGQKTVGQFFQKKSRGDPKS